MAKNETPAEVAERAQGQRPAQRFLSERAPRGERGSVGASDVDRHDDPEIDPADIDPADIDPADIDPADIDPADRRAVELNAIAIARRSLLEGAADTLVGRHHDLDEVDLDEVEVLERDRRAMDQGVSRRAAAVVGNDDEGEPALPRRRAYLRREDIAVALLDDEDVIDEAVQVAQSETPTFGLPRVGALRLGESDARRGTKVPLATLEQPSSSQYELTPSPVPRVSLTPATGAVDISLVPGPNGSRILPTLAAQHLLGRRQQRRPAAAVTVPPPNTTTARESGGRELGVGELARDVRSSKREVVWGLMIGLGLSLVLAGVGQAYLREPMIADGVTAPAEVESITLSARPDAPRASTASITESPVTAPRSATEATASPTAAITASLGAAGASPSSASRTAVSNGSVPSPASLARPRGQAASFAVAVNESDEASLLAHARGPARRTPERPTRAPGARKAPSIATEAPSFEHEGLPIADKSSDVRSIESGGKAFESNSAPAPRTPLSPAESAGLGLDLPL